MLISEFATKAGLPVDTVRFYIARGLLKPQRGVNGYQLFGESDVTAARMIRLQQSLGYSLKEIAALNREYRSGARSDKRTGDALRLQISRLEEKQTQIEGALSFLRGKLKWVEAGKPGNAPQLDQYYC